MKTVSLAACLALLAGAAAAQEATPADAARALEKRWLDLLPQGMSERTVLFEKIQPGRANGDSYPFRVTATVYDYGTGYPPNGYFGQTCTMKFTNETFRITPDDFGDWEASGRMNVFDDQRCADNPAEGVPAIPLSSVGGRPASAFGASLQPDPQSEGVRLASAGPRRLSTGPWACFGYGATILMSFSLEGDGTYRDGDGNQAGSFVYDDRAATIEFTDGPMNGQRGRSMNGRRFDLSRSVACEVSG